MSVLELLACRQNRNDEGPNMELAASLAAAEDSTGIAEVAEGLWSQDSKVRCDCIKVMGEAGRLKPRLIAPYAEDFLRLLTDKQNRMVWGAMAALATVAALTADILIGRLPLLLHALTNGSVITVDNGVKVLARVAASSPEYRRRIFPSLLHHLDICRPKEIPQHAESILEAVDETVREAYILMLKKREPELSPAQLSRIKRIYKSFL